MLGSSSGRRVPPRHDTQAGDASATCPVAPPPRHDTQAGGARDTGTVSPPPRNQVPPAEQRETHRSPSQSKGADEQDASEEAGMQFGYDVDDAGSDMEPECDHGVMITERLTSRTQV